MNPLPSFKGQMNLQSSGCIIDGWMNSAMKAPGRKYSGNPEIRYKYDTISRSVCYLGFGGLEGEGSNGAGVWMLNVRVAAMYRWFRWRATCLLTTRLLLWSPWSSRNKRPRSPLPLTLPLSLSSCLSSSRWQVFPQFADIRINFSSCFYYIMRPPPTPCLHYGFKFPWLCFFLIFVNGVAMKECLSAGHSCFRSSVILAISRSSGHLLVS